MSLKVNFRLLPESGPRTSGARSRIVLGDLESTIPKKTSHVSVDPSLKSDPENSHCRGKDICTVGLWFSCIGCDQTIKYVLELLNPNHSNWRPAIQ